MSTISHTFGRFLNQSINAPQHTIAVSQGNLYVYTTPTPTPVASAFNTVWTATAIVSFTTTSAGGIVAPISSTAMSVVDGFVTAVPTPPAAEAPG